MLVLDSLLMFCEKMSPLVGIDMNNLFGITNVKLKNAEIYVGSTKGVSCNNENLDYSNLWPIGRLVINSLLNVNIKLHKIKH